MKFSRYNKASRLARIPQQTEIGGDMTLCIDTQLTLRDLETYIKVQLDDHRYAEIAMDPVLDIILHAKKRLMKGDYMPRVVSEAMVGLDEYLMVYADCEPCSA